MKGMKMNKLKVFRRAALSSGVQPGYALAVSLCLLLAGCGAGGSITWSGLERLDSPTVPAQGHPDSGSGTSSLPDADRDGIPDDVEIILGTNPEFFDTDFDGLTDHWETWGIQGYPLGQVGDLHSLADPNCNGIIAPLDRGDMGDRVLKQASEVLYRERVPVTMPEEGAMLPNDVDGDGIPNEFELYGYYFEVAEDNQPYFVRWPWWQDLYELKIPYYKTDPTQWSSDGDPFSDWEEATKINLDQRIKSPGDHPCIPAYPQLECFLTSYSINLMQDVEITSSSGGKTYDGWEKTQSSISESTVEFDAHGGEFANKFGGLFECSVEDEYQIGATGGPPGATVTVTKLTKPVETKMFHWQSEDSYVGSHSIAHVTGELPGGFAAKSESDSGIAAEEWSTATTTAFNTAETANLILNLRLINSGTLPATNARILCNLYVGDVAISSFVIPLEEYGEILPLAENPLDVVVTHDGRSVPQKPMGDMLVLSMDQLRSIESGAPLKIETTGFVADTLVWEVDPETGRRTYLTMGPWAPYESSIENTSARIIVDCSNDPTWAPASINGLPPRGAIEVRVYCPSPNSVYMGSPPVITLTNALVWAFGAKNSSIGPTLTIRDPISRSKHTSSIIGWNFHFDKLTLEKLTSDPDYATSFFTLPIEPSNPGDRVYICKAPPQGERAKPRIYWANCNPLTRKVRAFSYDVQGVTEMRFKPDPDADYDGELMKLGFDPADPDQEFSYTYELPSQYKWTGFEQVVAINRIGKRTAMNIDIIGPELGFETGQGVHGVTGPSYTQGFNFSGGAITNPDYDLIFKQHYDGDNNLQIELDPKNGAGLHDALYVIDPDPDGVPPVYLLDYNYLRKQVYDPAASQSEVVAPGESEVPPLCRTYCVKSQTGVLAVFKPVLSSEDIGGGDYRYYVSSIAWRTYDGI